jgi:hypothetical protein
MANVATVRGSLRLQFTIDSDATSATGTPITVTANRQYAVTDYAVAVTVGSEANEQLILEIAGGAQQANVVASSTGWKRPSVLTVAATDAGLLPTAAIPRTSTLRIRALSTGATLGASTRATGTFLVLPGDRYNAGAATTNYYPNNPAANRFSS